MRSTGQRSRGPIGGAEVLGDNSGHKEETKIEQEEQDHKKRKSGGS